MAFLQLHVDGVEFLLNLAEIVSLRPTEMGKMTFIRTTDGNSVSVDENFNSVVAKLKEVLNAE